MPSHLLALLLAPFRTGFTRPTWRKALILLEGTLLARGRRTVTVALRMMGLHHLAQFNVFHHVLSRARWSPLQMSKVLFLLLVRTFVPAGARPFSWSLMKPWNGAGGHISANVASTMIRCAPPNGHPR